MLRQWARTADSDLIIAEALVGSSLGPGTTLAEALAAALSGSDAESAAEHSISSSSCLPVLAQPISSAMLDQLQAARGLALSPSPSVKLLAAQVGSMRSNAPCIVVCLWLAHLLASQRLL